MKGSKVSMPDSGSGTSSKSRIHGQKLQVHDINPSEMEMVQSYMDGVLYEMEKVQPYMDGHPSDIEINDDDDDDVFVDLPLRRERTSFPIRSSMDPPMEPDKMYVESPKDAGASAHMSPPHAAYTADFEADSSYKLNIVVHVQENIRTDLLEIKSIMKFLSNVVTAMVTSSMDQIMDMFKEIGESKCTGAVSNQEEGKNVDASVDRKGKGKMYPNVQTFDLMNLEPPSFDLGIGCTQPTLHVSPIAARSSRLPLKRVSRIARILQSPFVSNEGKHSKSSDNIIVFRLYNQHFEDVDVAAFKSWFHKGVQLPLSFPWSEVDRVLMPILPTKKSHWMLVVLVIKERTMSIFNSAAGVEPFVRVIPHLMRAIGLWTNDPDNDEGDSMELRIVLGYDVPQQQNGDALCNRPHIYYVGIPKALQVTGHKQ
ncbi:sentrin-specific protease 1-like [Olea europaea subsp. europaea]|uniref:Sentrin-specific protease 1-like n=1 Tax=Olea europaea subsp. europaea TaxID=158383 RepID=A0A8S0TLP0_OLEEU|nr:sentrin-specific protease 1-like [Olea europaea subsp. europaea]